MMDALKPYRKWFWFALFNLTLLAAVGSMLRYKIAFSLPWIDQKSLLHAHSHFAFAGWISIALMILMVFTVEKFTGRFLLHRYNWALIANVATAYGMLFTFPFGGYTVPAIIFSTLNLSANWWFAVLLWKDTVGYPLPLVFKWFRAAMVWMVLSAAGPFALAWQMIHHLTEVKPHLVAEYFFLHFQYNGWFLFGAMGLLYSVLPASVSASKLKNAYRLFLYSVVPAFFLSVLWLKIPVWFYWIIVLAALLQLLAWAELMQAIRNVRLIHFASRILWILVAVAFTIKLLLQAASTIPELSHFAFGYRPVVIGYLHLIFLGVFTFFLLGAAFYTSVLKDYRFRLMGLWIFVFGVIANEVLLFIQGLTAVAGTWIDSIQIWLFVAAITMFSGLVVMLSSDQTSHP